MRDRVPLRLRVAIAFAVTTAVAVAGLGAFVYYRVEATLTDQTRSALATQLDALARLPPGDRPQTVEQTSGDSFAQILTQDGDPVASSPQVSGPVLPPGGLPEVSGSGAGTSVEQPVLLKGEGEVESALLLVRRDDERVLVVGTSLDDVDEALDKVLTQLLTGGPLALVLASAIGYVVAGSALRPIERMRQRAAAISADSSEERLPLPAAQDELNRLGHTLNEMLDRLDAGLKRERRFVAEASHELRTPLALLRMELDLALERPRGNDELRAALGSTSEEVDRLTRLAEELLLLAAADEGRLRLSEAELDVGELLQQLAARFAARAAGHDRRVRVTDDYPVFVRADRTHLDRALSNLVDNALRHGAGDVGLSVESTGGRVLLRVSDSGSGMPPDFRDRAFDRFSRGPDAESAGQGLGLAIVRAFVDELHGSVAIGDGDGGQGTVVTIELPGPLVE